MAKETKNTSLDTCPIKFSWGTFCEHVLAKDSTRSIIDIRPACSGLVKISKSAPKRLTVDLGANDVLVVFARERGFKGLIDEDLTVTSNMPGSKEVSVSIKLEEQHKHYLHCLRLTNFPVEIARDATMFEETYWVAYSWKGKELGRVPIEIEIVVQDPDRGKSKKSLR